MIIRPDHFKPIKQRRHSPGTNFQKTYFTFNASLMRHPNFSILFRNQFTDLIKQLMTTTAK